MIGTWKYPSLINYLQEFAKRIPSRVGDGKAQLPDFRRLRPKPSDQKSAAKHNPESAEAKKLLIHLYCLLLSPGERAYKKSPEISG